MADNKIIYRWVIWQVYRSLFCTVADWTVTMKGPMKGADGKIIQPTGKTAKLEFCTVATWKNGEIVEERLFYDVVGFMQQLGQSK